MSELKQILNEITKEVIALRANLLLNDSLEFMDENPEAAQFLLLALADMESAVCHLRLVEMKLK